MVECLGDLPKDKYYMNQESSMKKKAFSWLRNAFLWQDEE